MTTQPEKPSIIPEVRAEWLPTGLLRTVSPLPAGVPANFHELLATEQPWYHNGTHIMEETASVPSAKDRRVELFTIGGVSMVLKEARFTLPELRHTTPNSKRHTISMAHPLSQLTIINTARKRFEQKYGIALLVEEPLGSFTDIQSGKMFMFFQGYKYSGTVTEEMRQKMREVGQIWEDMLEEVGIEARDAVQVIPVDDPSRPDGFHLVAIDTEDWRLL